MNENKVIYFSKNDNKSILETGEKIDYKDDTLPVLINEIKNKKVYDKLDKIDRKAMNYKCEKYDISEIKYDPNTIDNERFLVSINDEIMYF